VVFLNAFSTKHGEVVRAVKVLNALFVFLTKQAVDALFIFKVDVSQDTVSLHDFVQNVEVQRQLVHTFHLLHQFATNRASYAVVVVKLTQTLCTKSMTTVNQDPRNLFANIEFAPTIVAVV
jgi:phosphoglycerol transferase MdoB-like AlkP superfamily enzyme